MTDLTKIEKPFGLLDESTQKALRECGGPWEVFDDDGWVDTADPGWFHGSTYRQKPQPPKPREWWIGELSGVAYPAEPQKSPPNGSYYIHVREVIE
jgi:hypothetical protein